MIHLIDKLLEDQLNEATNCEFHYKLQKNSVENNRFKEFFTVNIDYKDDNIEVVLWFEKSELFAENMPDTWEDEQIQEASLPNIGSLWPPPSFDITAGVPWDYRAYDLLHRLPSAIPSHPNDFSLEPATIKTKQVIKKIDGKEVRYVVMDEHKDFEEQPSYTTLKKPLNWTVNPYVDFETVKSILKDDTQSLTDYFRIKDLKKCM